MRPPDAAPLVDVQILGLPLELLERAREHQDSLEREFRLIALARPEERSHVTARLLEIVHELAEPFPAPGVEQEEQFAAARARGDQTIDLVVRVPGTAADASRRRGALLDEADAFCRQGELLNLATPPDCVELRHWYLGEFIAQVDGAAPTRWPPDR